MYQGSVKARVRPGSERLYPSNLVGRAVVKCLSCGERGETSARLVGRARTIPKCGECKYMEGLK